MIGTRCRWQWCSCSVSCIGIDLRDVRSRWQAGEQERLAGQHAARERAKAAGAARISCLVALVAPANRLMKLVHPDVGGSNLFAKQLNEARDRLLEGAR